MHHHSHTCTRTHTHTAAGVEGVTWSKFLLHNLLPVTLGNIFAGAVCVATLYSLAFGELGRRVNRALANATA